MPNYIVNTPQFNPIDFETRIKPMAAYVDTFNKQMDALDNAGVLGDTIGGLIDPNKDAELMEIYNSYSNLLGNTVDSMLSTGDVSSSRNNLRTLRRKYANELLPIQQGYTSWQEAIKNYDTQKAKDNTFIGTDPRKYSISNYMRGNSPQDYSVSGQTLYSMGAADAKAASARNKMYTEWGLDPNLAGQYFSRALVEGWSQDELAAALKNEIVAQKGKAPSDADLNGVAGYLYDAYNRIAKTTGIDNFTDDDLYTQAGGYILNGIISGIGYDIKDERANNENFLNPLERARLEGAKLDNEYKRIRNIATQIPESSISESYSTPYDLIDNVEVSKDRKVTAKEYNKLAEIINGVNNGDFNLKDTAIKGNATIVGGSNVSPGTQITTPDITYEELLKGLVDKFNIEGITWNTVENEIGTGKTKSKIEMTPEAKNKLDLALAATIQLSSDKRFKNADSNKRVIDHLNGRITSTKGSGLVLDENGRDITNRGDKKNEVYQIPEGAQILLTSDGNLVAVTKDRKKKYLNPSLVSGNSQKNVEYNGNRLSVNEALSLYAKMYDGLNSLNIAVTPEAYFDTSIELSRLSDAVLRALDGEANSYPIVQSTSGKIEQ